MSGRNLFLVYVTCGSKKEAQQLAKALVEGKLVACANFFPITSVFFWKKKLAKEKEWLLLAKTTRNKFKRVKALVRKMHSYDVPCILGFRVAEANAAYAEWVRESVSTQLARA